RSSCRSGRNSYVGRAPFRVASSKRKIISALISASSGLLGRHAHAKEGESIVQGTQTQAASLLRAMASCPKPHRDRRTLKKPFQLDGLKQVLQSALDSIERTELGCSLPSINADSSVVVDRRYRAC